MLQAHRLRCPCELQPGGPPATELQRDEISVLVEISLRMLVRQAR